jgi:3-dehydroquinate synthetase
MLIFTEYGAIGRLRSIISDYAIDKVIFVHDPKVPRAFLQQCAGQLRPDQSAFVALQYGGEVMKSLSTLQWLLDQISLHATRDSGVVAVGGGTTSNAAGMAAGLLYRGIKLIHIPTTPLAQADAAIGLKQAVNSVRSKNIYGLYHQPLAVLNDLAVMPTLSTETIREGLAEVAKVGLATSPAIYALLMDWADPNLRTILPEPKLGQVIHMAAMAKLQGLPDDPYETGHLRLMELGHVTAHTLEAASNFTISHGTAVAAGLMVEANYSLEIGTARDNDLICKFQTVLSDRIGFARHIAEAPSVANFSMALANSNKRGAQGIEIILPVRIGETVVATITDHTRLSKAYFTSVSPHV